MLEFPEIEDGYEMGKVVTRFKVQNWSDTERLALGETDKSPRSFEGEAIVDTGAVHLYLKASVIAQLGLRPTRRWSSTTMSNRTESRRMFSPVDLEIMGRSATFEVVELPDGLPNVIGQIPLEAMDWVIDMRTHRLVGNPEHGGEWLGDDFTEIEGRME
jgi:predicted aspartyl protease